ncbi:hypothetical protein [Streptomyces albus]|uniref:hypothetical protein n=1 Tax=Streptomyces sp. PHES57 TaxID=2872626 RepID=UPI001CECD86C|nr:hypothetical protein [Streptomyces sp. PHES57]
MDWRRGRLWWCECQAVLLIARRTPGGPPSLYYFTDDQLAAESGHALVELAATNGPSSPKRPTYCSRSSHRGGDVGYCRSAVLHGSVWPAPRSSPGTPKPPPPSSPT